jgi:agmatinase
MEPARKGRAGRFDLVQGRKARINARPLCPGERRRAKYDILEERRSTLSASFPSAMPSSSNFRPPRNFGGLPPEYSAWETARFAVVPAPYDATTTGPVGARNGPAAILEASQRLEHFERTLGREVCRAGIHTTAEIEPVLARPEAMAVRVTEVIGEALFAGKIPVLLGGEHSLTFGAVCAALKLDLAGDLTVVQLDARPDLRAESSGTRWGRDSVARRLAALPGARVVQAGLRATSLAEYSAIPPGVTQFWCEEMLDDFSSSVSAILDAAGPDVYLSFDVSVCDPSWMPATGAPEPNGLSYSQVRELMRALCTQRRVRGLDCVELIGDHPAAAFAAARLLYLAMGYLSAETSP